MDSPSSSSSTTSSTPSIASIASLLSMASTASGTSTGSAESNDSSESMGSPTDPWNRTDIKPPPRCAVNTHLTPPDVQVIQEMKLIINEAISALSRLKVFRNEAVLLSKFLYKFKRAFRQDKGVQNLVKINQAFRRYENLKLEQAMSSFVQFIPYNITWTTPEAYLPTRQMLKWVLLRILTMSKILMRIMQLSKEAGKYLFGRLHLGWSAHYMIFGLAVTGRIRTCAKYVLLLASSWYHRLVGYMNILLETTKFLPNFRFPRTLEEFIGDLHQNRPSKKNMDTVFELIDLTKDDYKEKRKKKKIDDDDDVIITNEVFRTVVPKEGSQDGQKVVVEEIRTNYNFADEEMAIVFERRKVLKPSENGPPSVISQTTSISHSSSKPKPRPSTSAPSAARATAARTSAARASSYRASVSRGSAYRTLLSRGPAYLKHTVRAARPRAAKVRAARARAARARAAGTQASGAHAQEDLERFLDHGEQSVGQENFPPSF